MNKTLIFTGAGMSIPLGLPGTTDFIEAVRKSSRQITNHAINYLGSSGGDIEWLLSTLESFNNETPFTEFLLPHIASASGLTNVLSRIQQPLANLRSESTIEVTRIKKIIFDKLSKYETGRASSLYINLLKEIKKCFTETAISIITTNYDLTFESAIEASSDDLKNLGIKDVNFGFSIEFGRPIYNASQDFSWSPSAIEYLKIHGSVDWHRDAKGRCSRSMSNTVPDDPDQMAILYPGFKGVPETEPFISMHGRLNRRLAESDNIIIIGFAFRDSYINNIFENMLRLRPKTKILYFNPLSIDEFPEDSSVPHFVKNYPSFQHIEKKVEIKESPLGLKELLTASGKSD